MVRRRTNHGKRSGFLAAAFGAALFAASAVPVEAQIDVPGADGSDGALNLSGSQNPVIDLSLAATGTWDMPSPVAGQGVYDPDRWAVVFKYSSVNINLTNTNFAVTFANHPSRAPVVWLVSGDVTITNGVLRLSGQNGVGCAGFPEPGPGGFRGGRGAEGAAHPAGGLGVGGGNLDTTAFNAGWTGGSYAEFAGTTYGEPASPPYGNARIIPLIGGSGGAAGFDSLCRGGGAGGGAILIAAEGTISINGQIVSDGGAHSGNGAGGSGGAIRLIADQITGAGLLLARGGAGGNPFASGGPANGSVGRIAIEANLDSLSSAGNPPIQRFPLIDDEVLLWPPDEAPTVTATHLTVGISDVPIPADPRSSFNYPFSDVSLDSLDPVTLHIEARNVPLDWLVEVRVTPRSGAPVRVMADALSGSLALSTTTALLNLPRDFGAIQVRAYAPPQP